MYEGRGVISSPFGKLFKENKGRKKEKTRKREKKGRKKTQGIKKMYAWWAKKDDFEQFTSLNGYLIMPGFKLKSK